MIFAAGRGTRMGDLTAQRPKPLMPVAGRPLLDHALDLARGVDPARIVVNTHYLGDQIAAHLDAQTDVILSDEVDLLETGGGLRHALPLLGDGPVFTMNSDAVWTGSNPFHQLRAAWDGDRMDALLLMIDPSRAHGHKGTGDFIIADDGRITRGAGVTYSGAQIIRTDGLNDIAEDAFSLNKLWDIYMARGRVYGIVHDGAWCDVGHPQGIEIAEQMVGYSGV